jgi:hypothetical protein
MAQKDYPHYFKALPPGITHVDVYRVLDLFKVTDPCLQHAVKKLLVAGGRGHKDIDKDVREAVDSLLRWQQMRLEEKAKPGLSLQPDGQFVIRPLMAAGV